MIRHALLLLALLFNGCHSMILTRLRYSIFKDMGEQLNETKADEIFTHCTRKQYRPNPEHLQSAMLAFEWALHEKSRRVIRNLCDILQNVNKDQLDVEALASWIIVNSTQFGYLFRKDIRLVQTKAYMEMLKEEVLKNRNSLFKTPFGLAVEVTDVSEIFEFSIANGNVMEIFAIKKYGLLQLWSEPRLYDRLLDIACQHTCYNALVILLLHSEIFKQMKASGKYLGAASRIFPDLEKMSYSEFVNNLYYTPNINFYIKRAIFMNFESVDTEGRERFICDIYAETDTDLGFRQSVRKVFDAMFPKSSNQARIINYLAQRLSPRTLLLTGLRLRSRHLVNLAIEHVDFSSNVIKFIEIAPYLEIQVLLEEPEPALRHKIDEILKFKNVKLALAAKCGVNFLATLTP